MSGLKKKNSNGSPIEMSYTFYGTSILGMFTYIIMGIPPIIWFLITYFGWNWVVAIVCLAITAFAIKAWIDFFKNRVKMVIDNQGIHVFLWNGFHKEIPAKEIVYHKWDDIRYVRYKMPESKYGSTYLILSTKQGKNSIDIGEFIYPYTIGLKKIKRKIIQISGREDIFKK